jgi:hypothetical protein
MAKMDIQERERGERHQTLIRFLEKTQKGEYAEITTIYIATGRLPNYTFTNYEEDVYIFSYS